MPAELVPEPKLNCALEEFVGNDITFAPVEINPALVIVHSVDPPMANGRDVGALIDPLIDSVPVPVPL
jgi:hypothetical protein